MVDTGQGATAFAPPAPGFWELETTHHGHRPLSHLVRTSYVRAFSTGIEAMLARYGLPLAGIQAELVEGCMYVRPRGVGEGKTPSAPPPALVLKVLMRLHPKLRRRNRAASRAWAERRWRLEVDRWFGHERPAMLARNLELQRVDPASLDDHALAATSSPSATGRSSCAVSTVAGDEPTSSDAIVP